MCVKTGNICAEELSIMYSITKYFLFWALFSVAAPSGLPPPPPGTGQMPGDDGNWFLLPDDDTGALHWVDVSAPPQPFTVNDDDVAFQLYTRADPNNPTNLRIGDVSSLGNFNAARRTEFVIHGWNSNGGSMSVVTNAYMRSGQDLNVIVVDWRRPANQAYQTSAANARQVGVITARLVDFLISRGLSPANINIVGFSLGAHVAGVAGQRSRSAIGRVTGLDPAGPMWGTVPRTDRLDPNSAQHVQVIHTNGRTLGFGDNLGHADFYPNGGSRQEGCGIDLVGSCSHGRANQFYAESILGGRFTARQCASWQLFTQGSCANNNAVAMGFGIPSGARGVYFLQTNGQSPFARG